VQQSYKLKDQQTLIFYKKFYNLLSLKKPSGSILPLGFLLFILKTDFDAVYKVDHLINKIGITICF